MGIKSSITETENTEPPMLPDPKKSNLPHLYAAIDLGSSGLRMRLVEMHGTQPCTLEDVNQIIAVGKDVFVHGRIQPETVQAVVNALRQFRRLLMEYAPMEGMMLRAVATSAIREAENRDAFIDRIFVSTGIQVEIASDVDVNRMTYLALVPLIRRHAELQKGEFLAAEVGGGVTEFLGFNSANITFAKTSRLGLLRLAEQCQNSQLSPAKVRPFLTDQIDASLEVLNGMTFTGRTPRLLLQGAEARFAVQILGKKPLNAAGENDDLPLWKIDVHALDLLAGKLLELSPEQIAERYNLTFSASETLGIALLVYLRLAVWYNVRTIYVSQSCLRDGIIAEMLGGPHWTKAFCHQVKTSAVAIGRKYFWSEKHAHAVAAYAVAIFDALKQEHALPEHYRLILEVAALLHDIGAFISPKQHHLHSMYLIRYSDIFGLSDRYIYLIALMARYHRKGTPLQSEREFTALPAADRIILLKLCGILRVADALDRAHVTRLGLKLKFSLTETEFEIIPGKAIANAALERYSLSVKGMLFQEVFGLEPVILTL